MTIRIYKMTTTLFQRLSLALFSIIAIFILVTFKQYGISNDEQVQHVYGQLLLNFYSTGFVDKAAFAYKNLYLYGGLFDLISALLEKILPIWVWDVRHLLSALFGLAGIVAVHKVTHELAGARAAFFAAFLLAITGAWSGAMFTHTKDVSFAACMVWALYYTLLTVKNLPRIPLVLSLRLGLTVGLALGLRIGGAFAVIYLLMMVFIAGLLNTNTCKLTLMFYWHSFLSLLPAGVVAFCLMAFFWPWSVMGIDHIFIAAKSFSHFAFDMNTIVDGQFVSIGAVPRSYLFQYLAIRLPEIFLLGLVSLMIIFMMRFKQLLPIKANNLPEITIAIALVTPLAFVIWDRPALYNGVRHFTFVIPTLAIVAGIGFSKVLDVLAAHKKLCLSFTALCVCLSINTLSTLYALHPYEYIYYNHFAGVDFKHDEHDWEADYWSSSLIEASRVLERYVDTEDATLQHQKSVRYSVAVCAEAFQGQAYLDKRFYITEDWVKADFYLSSTNMNCDKVLQGKVIGMVERLGATLAVVKDRRELTGEVRMPHAAPRD